MSLRVLWVSQDFVPDRGGVQTYSGELVRALTAAGHRVEVVAPKAHGDRAHDGGFPCVIHRVACLRDAMPVASVPTVSRLLGAGRFDAVVCAQWNTALGPAIARARRRVGCLAIAAHGRELLWRPALGGAMYARARRELLGRADVVFAVSRFTARLAAELGIAPAKLEVVRNGTDPRAFDDPRLVAMGAALRARHGGPLVVTVARLVPHKGIDTMLRAIARLGGVRYVVVGAGPDAPRLRALASALGVADRVIWRDRADDRERSAWLHAADVFALLSRRRGCDVEGFGIVLLEAAACGKAVLAARSGGIPDAVVDGATGVLCDGDDPQTVAGHLDALLGDPVRRDTLGRAARARLERELDWSHAAAAIAARLHSNVARVHRSVTDPQHLVIGAPHPAATLPLGRGPSLPG